MSAAGGGTMVQVKSGIGGMYRDANEDNERANAARRYSRSASEAYLRPCFASKAANSASSVALALKKSDSMRSRSMRSRK